MRDIYEKRAREQREREELDAALARWVEKQSAHNSVELYRKACAYLGVRVNDGDADSVASNTSAPRYIKLTL